MALEDRIRGLQLEDRIHASVDQVLGELRTRIEHDLQHMVEQLVNAAAEEREEAIVVARRAAFDEGSQNGLRLVAEAEARGQESLERAVAGAREEERQSLGQQIADARASVDARVAQVLDESRARENGILEQAVKAAREIHRDTETTSLTRLLASIRALDGATSLSETLDALGQAASREVRRAAVLVVKNARLHGWKLAGFADRDTQPRAVDLGLNEEGLLGLALTSGRAASTEAGTAATAPAFADLPAGHLAVAIPVVVGGRAVAVLFADAPSADGDADSPRHGWSEVMEILARHAARCLEALTVQRTTAAPAPRFWVAPSAGAPATSPQRAGSASGASPA
jgi:hypothetical protein